MEIMRPAGMAQWRAPPPPLARHRRLWWQLLFRKVVMPTFATAFFLQVLMPAVPPASSSEQQEEHASNVSAVASLHSESEADFGEREGRHAGESPTRLRGKRKQQDAEQSLLQENTTRSQQRQAGRLANVGLVELQEDTVPWRVAKVLVPLRPEVARWWTSTGEGDFQVKMKPCLAGGEPHVHLQVWAPQPLDLFPGQPQIEGLHSIIYMPPGTVLEACRLDWVKVSVNTEPLAALGKLRALHVSCPVSPRRSTDGSSLSSGGGLGGMLVLALFTWLLLPWPLLLLPTIIYSAARPAAFGAGLVLARAARFLRRRRRLWRLGSLGRRKIFVDDVVFGEDEPCCICFGTQAEATIALLPCRHAMHLSCYRSWVGADSYPSHELICPLCRAGVTEVGKLSGK